MTVDRFAAARAVADAVLYEGYVLYPYRASATKNRLRWSFGVLTPGAVAATTAERSSTHTECLMDAGPAASLVVRVRFLQVQHRRVLPAPERAGVDGRLEVDGEVYLDWDEAVDRVVDLAPMPAAGCADHAFAVPGGLDTEAVHDRHGAPAGLIVRGREALAGTVHVAVEPAGPGPLRRVAVTVDNTTAWPGTATDRDAVMARSLVSLHTMLAVDGGRFVSLIDPPEAARVAAARCRNDGCYPVLIGADDVVLSSPIILYDHPEVAAESPGDLYDSTEIDEILALRVLTLTEEEKKEARATDRRAAAIVDRCDNLPPEVWDRLHGAVRSLETAPAAPVPPASAQPQPQPWWDPAADAAFDPWTGSVTVMGTEVTKGSAVRLHPSRRADAQDLFVAGRAATVAGVFTDVDGDDHIAVTVDDDPANEELTWQGRYLFFHPDEVEPLGPSGGTP